MAVRAHGLCTPLPALGFCDGRLCWRACASTFVRVLARDGHVPQRYCDELIGDHDDELTKILREGLSLDALTQRVCYTMVKGAEPALGSTAAMSAPRGRVRLWSWLLTSCRVVQHAPCPPASSARP
jgi:hypothetical protein